MKSAKGKLIPGFENYAVYEDGTVINTETGETLKGKEFMEVLSGKEESIKIAV